MHNPSIIRARYILSLLRVARDAEADDAIRLLKGLASEYRHPDMPTDMKPFELEAIEAVGALASALGTSDKQHALWERANAVANDWLNAAS